MSGHSLCANTYILRVVFFGTAIAMTLSTPEMCDLKRFFKKAYSFVLLEDYGDFLKIKET